MLLQLNISNFALIENLTISFENGFNVLTGETGAGKSIIIDAISFVLGGKFNKNLIRIGEEKTFVEAVFDVENQHTKKILQDMEIEFEDLIIISRETFKNGKSLVKINGKSILISQIKILSQSLINIHGQHENQDLLNTSKHIYYLDKFGNEKLKSYLQEYKQLYNKMLYIEQKINDLEIDSSEREQLMDFFSYQINEIEKSNLKINEDIELEKQYSVLSNFEKINAALSYSYNILYNSDDNFISIYDSLNKVIRELKNIEDKLDTVPKIVNSLEEAYYNIEQNITDIRSIEQSICYDRQELDFVNSRIFQIDSLKKKYGNSIEEILEYKNNIIKKYEDMLNGNEIIEKLKEQKESICIKLKETGKNIHNIRLQISLILEKRIQKELTYVGLEKSVFKISVNMQEIFHNNGCDKVEFLISTNPGQPVKTLESVVSGGELSRIMLALKTVFITKNEISSIIFDEIDTGISGRTAQRVAEKMYLISRQCQVFCITHLPQIAAMSDYHFLISKETKNDKTYTNIKKLSKKYQEQEVARMIGGSEITDLTIKNAKEIINLASEKKSELVYPKKIRN